MVQALHVSQDAGWNVFDLVVVFFAGIEATLRGDGSIRILIKNLAVLGLGLCRDHIVSLCKGLLRLCIRSFNHSPYGDCPLMARVSFWWFLLEYVSLYGFRPVWELYCSSGQLPNAVTACNSSTKIRGARQHTKGIPTRG